MTGLSNAARYPFGNKHLSYLANIRLTQQSWGRRALGLFVAVWLNLALQPCAMAFTADSDCPNCPPAQTHEHAGLHGDMSGMDEQMPCADGLDDCFIDDDLNHDGRSGESKAKDAPNTSAAIFSQEMSLNWHRSADVTPRPRYASMHAGAPPSLHVLYCVYLD